MTQGLLLTADTVSPYVTTGAYITLLAGLLGFLLKYLFKKFDDALTKNAESIETLKVILQPFFCKEMISSGLPMAWRIVLRIKMEK